MCATFPLRACDTRVRLVQERVINFVLKSTPDLQLLGDVPRAKKEEAFLIFGSPTPTAAVTQAAASAKAAALAAGGATKDEGSAPAAAASGSAACVVHEVTPLLGSNCACRFTWADRCDSRSLL